jgi:hypothetical protein
MTYEQFYFYIRGLIKNKDVLGAEDLEALWMAIETIEMNNVQKQYIVPKPLYPYPNTNPMPGSTGDWQPHKVYCTS